MKIAAGDTIGLWTVIETNTKRYGPGRYAHLCQCECGTIRNVLTGNLRSGGSKSCGCDRKTVTGIKHHSATHGMTDTPEWLAHKNMLDRCYNRESIGYHRYGGRGIKVCDRWRGRNGFQTFLADVGRKPTPDHSLGRIDNDGHYEPSNVRWETRHEQGQNQSTNRLITFNGETLIASEWSRRIGCSIQALVARLDKYGWSIERSLTTPFKKYKIGTTHAGKTKSLEAWSRKTGLPRETIRSRLRKGWDVERALTTPYMGINKKDV